jgi:hypothetical protein
MTGYEQKLSLAPFPLDPDPDPEPARMGQWVSVQALFSCRTHPLFLTHERV